MTAKRLFNTGREPGLKSILVGALVILMGVPLFFVALIAEERQDRARDVVQEIGYEWGGAAQTVAGPFLAIPIDRDNRARANGQVSVNQVRRHLIVLPQDLSIEANVASDELHRGIYDVPVYAAGVHVTGHFPAVDVSLQTDQFDTVRWDEAFVVLSLGDTRGIRSSIPFTLEGEAHSFEPGLVLNLLGTAGAHAVLAPQRWEGLAADGRARFAESQTFDFTFSVNGTSQLRVVPLGQDTQVTMTSDWASPSFRGAFLPTMRDVTNDGFSASWNVPDVARSFPDVFVMSNAQTNPHADSLVRAAFGVDFLVPVDFYQLVFRALRYALLFIGACFLSFFLVELALKRRLHAIQYLMVGAAQSIFYLLLLSAAEHIGFTLAFAVAATATVGLTTAYAWVITQSRRAAAVLFAVMGLIYLLLYNLLKVEDFALLYGSIAAFVALAVTMFVTRNVNWYGESQDPDAGALSETAGVAAS